MPCYHCMSSTAYQPDTKEARVISGVKKKKPEKIRGRTVNAIKNGLEGVKESLGISQIEFGGLKHTARKNGTKIALHLTQGNRLSVQVREPWSDCFGVVVTANPEETAKKIREFAGQHAQVTGP